MSLVKKRGKTPGQRRFEKVKYTVKSSLKNGVTSTWCYEGYSIVLTDIDGSEKTFLFAPSELLDAKERAAKHLSEAKPTKRSIGERISSFFARLLSFG